MTDLRDALLALDQQIADLLEERATLSKKAGAELESSVAFDPRRSEELAKRTPSLPEASARRFFAAYYATVDPLVRQTTMAVVGAAGVQAAQLRHGDDASITVHDTLMSALDAVAKGAADAAILEYQRHGEGPMAASLDAIAATEGRIIHLFDGIDSRFAVVALRAAPKSGSDRTSLLIRVQDTPGMLQDVLARFSAHRVNLAKIHSYPALDGDYRFFLECDGHASDRPLVSAIDDVRKLARHVRVLGSYVRPGPSLRPSAQGGLL